MPAGRPSDYDPAYCEQVIEYGKMGKSLTWMAATIGVHKQTIYNWMETHPEFFDAMTSARDFCQLWWEDAGQRGMEADKFNSAVWAKNMTCRFRDDWTDRSEQVQTGPNGGPIQHQHDVAFVIIDPIESPGSEETGPAS